jgi:hypothetical protein
MRSRSARWTAVAVAWIALGAAASFLFSSEKQIMADAAALRAVDAHAHEATAALADLRAAQQAYVATGQGAAFWMPKVAAALDAVNTALVALHQSAVSPGAQSALNDGTATLAGFGTIDNRAREYIKSGQPLMAGDVIFTEGGQALAKALRQVEMARQAEHQAFDLAESDLRDRQALAMAGAAVFVGLILAMLAPIVGPEVETIRDAYKALAAADDGIVSHARAVQAAALAPPVPAPASPVVPAAAASIAPASDPGWNSPVLKAAADLATDFGRVRDSEELARLLARAAEMTDATGLILWLGGNNGEDLRPMIAHGYSAQALARMAFVPRSADNPAGAAYRTGSVQIAPCRPGGPNGAIVAPILAADGCIGALSAEIRGGGESSEAVQAIFTIVAAYLANIVAVSRHESADEETAAAN